MPTTSIGNKIHALRESQHITQQELAEKLHISRQSISRWETGSSQPTFDNIVSLSEIFNVTIDELLHADIELLDRFRQPNSKLFRLYYPLLITLIALLISIPAMFSHSLANGLVPDILETCSVIGLTVFMWIASSIQSWYRLPRSLRIFIWTVTAIAWLPILINFFGGFFEGIFHELS
ncbi:MAG: helix-turn-helix domain-containing protein [Lactobacillus sp.]|jgi:transcriptional regulator with XRE-family HTH domain|nr:helix-turn-helix domain-containing protein [Lactobacillus sp.]MCI2033027.1 helix-turn-helix domain-containing protein [Lactobacillus sp.]